MKAEWIDRCKRWKSKWPIFKDSFIDDSNGVNLYNFIEILNSVITKNETIVSDAGSAIYVPCQNLKLKEGQDFIISGAQADMGFALPASIGVYLADSTKNVLVVTGDGSFNTNIQELAVIRSLNVPIKIFVWNNNGYLSIRNTQSKFYEGRVYGTDKDTGLWFPELESVAKTYEFDFVKLSTNVEVRDNLLKIINNKNPMICEVICDPNQDITPTLMLKEDEATGEKIQCGLDDMFPFLSQAELDNEKYN
tara:strand:- start:805 stop:1554 length:750 start_codon:yes stop_codon:yes gene_type:complete